MDVARRTLQDELARGPIAPARAVELTAALAQALTARPAPHLQLDPARVHLGAAGPELLEPVGAADLRYRAPEQWGGGAAPGPPSDVYALGALLWHMLTGVPPPDGRRGSPAVPPAGWPELEALLRRALALRPEERPDAASLRAQLLALPPAPSPLPRRAAYVGGGLLALGLGLALGVGLAFGGPGGLVSWMRSGEGGGEGEEGPGEETAEGPARVPVATPPETGCAADPAGSYDTGRAAGAESAPATGRAEGTEWPAPTGRAQVATPEPTGRTDAAEPAPTGRTDAAEPAPTGRTDAAEPAPTGRADAAEPTPTGRADAAEPAPTGRADSAEPAPTGRADAAEPTPTGRTDAPRSPTETGRSGEALPYPTGRREGLPADQALRVRPDGSEVLLRRVPEGPVRTPEGRVREPAFWIEATPPGLADYARFLRATRETGDPLEPLFPAAEAGALLREHLASGAALPAQPLTGLSPPAEVEWLRWCGLVPLTPRQRLRAAQWGEIPQDDLRGGLPEAREGR